jgi:lipid A 3-O-deacylase
MIRKFAAAAAACLVCSTGHCIDAVAVEVGHGDDKTSLLRLALIDRWRKAQKGQPPQWRLAGYWEFSAGAWDNSEESTADVGFTPVFRIERSRLYLEAAIGVHLVQARISAHRTFSTALQFAEHVGAGVHMGKRYDLGVRVQHLSNGGIHSPNPGINFLLVHLHYALE